MGAFTLIKVSDPQPVIDYLVGQLTTALDEGNKVAWLIPGGSAIGVAVAVSKQLVGHDLTNLSVTLTDERYGELGHADSNWQQLENQGFSLVGAKLWPVIIGEDREITTDRFSATLAKLLDESDYSLGFFGIGPDGHTAGILPNSPAVTATNMAADYDANFERITMTPPAIARLDEAVVFAMGEPKWPIMDQLAQTLPLADQPAQILKKVPKVTIFNDYKDANI